ncbi:MAG: DUF4352 domain-containing protein [archaeon]
MAKKDGKKEATITKKPNNSLIAIIIIAMLIVGFAVGMWFSKTKEVSVDVKEKCFPKWECNDWSECKEGSTNRVCNDINQCGTEEGRPNDIDQCTFQGTTTDVNKELISYQIEYNVDKVTTAEKVGERNASGLFYIVQMTITSARDQSVTFTELPFSLVDSMNNEYLSNPPAESAYSDNGITALTNLTKFMPNKPLSGVKIFEAPRDASGLQLKIGCCKLVSKPEYIQLGI